MDSHLSEQTAISADNHLCGQPSLCGRPSLSAVSSDSRVAKYGTTREKPGYASASINAALTTARSTAPEARPTSAKPTEEVVVGISLSGDLATLLAVMEAFHREQMELLAQTRVMCDGWRQSSRMSWAILFSLHTCLVAPKAPSTRRDTLLAVVFLFQIKFQMVGHEGPCPAAPCLSVLWLSVGCQD